jgi:hypothetical protein
MSQSSEIFSSSTASPMLEESTSSQVDFLASLSVRPGSDEARRMTAISGLKCCELLKKSDPVSLLAKTLLSSSKWHSTIVCLTWKMKATPAGRLLFQLAPSTPNIGETGCGLWPTPTLTPEAPNANSNTVNGPTSLGEAAKLWPTPCSEKISGRSRGDFSMTLPEAARMFRTPLATDGQKSGHGNLPHQVKMLPTPRANDAEKRGDFDETNPRNGLPAAVRMWPTPSATETTGGGSSAEALKAINGDLRPSGNSCQLRLRDAVKLWPTPTNQDAKNSTLPISQVERDSIVGGGVLRMLNSQTGPEANVECQALSQKSRRKVPKLSVTFVEWLMGYPEGWTDLKASETPSSRKSPTKSSKKSESSAE